MHSMFRVLAVSAVMAVSMSASAAEPVEIIKYRQNVMKVNGAAMANATAIVQGKVDDKTHLVDLARTLEANNKNVLTLFPKGTESGADTQALPAIWQKTDDFVAKAKDLQAKSAAFAKAAAGSDMQAITAAHKELAGTCRACHTDYRKKQ